MENVRTFIDSVDFWLDVAWHATDPIVEADTYRDGYRDLIDQMRRGVLVERAIERAQEDPGWG